MMVEPQSCSSTGNPINIATGRKFEHEIDYRNADGSIQIVRRYIDQYTGWSVEEPDHVVEISSSVAVPTETVINRGKLSPYSMAVRRHRNVATSDGLLTVEPYTFIVSHALYNPSEENIVLLSLDGTRYRFVETQGGYVGDGPIDAKVKLAKINPEQFNGARWKLVHASGDISYFGINGYLLRRTAVTGITWLYEYDASGLLITKTDTHRSVAYEYDTHKRLVSITPPDGQPINYEYGQDEDETDFWLIKKVTWADGSSVSYSYNEPENINGTTTQFMLTGKLDSFGNRIGTYKYSSGKAISTEGALGVDKKSLQFYSNFTYVTDGLGNRGTHYFNTTLVDGTKLKTGTTNPPAAAVPPAPNQPHTPPTACSPKKPSSTAASPSMAMTQLQNWKIAVSRA